MMSGGHSSLRPVFTAIPLRMLFRFWVYVSAFPSQKQKNRRSPMFTAIPFNISNAILRVAPPFKKIAFEQLYKFSFSYGF
jgi:hypothetical protein